MQKKLNLIKMLLCLICTSLALFISSCSNDSILMNNETAVTSLEDGLVEPGTTQVILMLPDVGRSWDIEKYVVTASREGEEDKVFETTTGKVSLRLKIGTWKFTAVALDSYGNVLYNAATSATLKDSKNAIYLQLIKRTANVQVQFKSDIFVQGVLKYVVTAERGQGFESQQGEVYVFSDKVTLQYLSMGDWTIKAVAQDENGTAFYSGTEIFSVNADNIGETTVLPIELKLVKVPSPVFDVQGGKVVAGTVVTVSATNGATVYYTIDGSDPGPYCYDNYGSSCNITINENTTIKAVSAVYGMDISDIVEYTYTIASADEVADVQISPLGGTITNPTRVTLTCGTEGAAIYYTTDGTTPTSDSTAYTGEILVSETQTIKAVAIKGSNSSSVASQTYTYIQTNCVAPTITPSSGTYLQGTKITITCNATGATTYYTIDGSDPTTESSSFESDKIQEIDTTDMEGTFVIKAKSVKAGRADSEIECETIIIKKQDNNDDNGSASFKLVDNLIVANNESTASYTSVGTKSANTTVWFGFVHDLAGSVHIDVTPSATMSVELYKNGQKDNAKVAINNNIASLEAGENFYYLKLTATALSSNIKVRLYNVASVPTTSTSSTSSTSTSSTTTTLVPNKTLSGLTIKSVGTSAAPKFTATAVYSDGSTNTVTSSVKWTSSNTSVATIAANGTVTLKSAGETKITSSYTEGGVTKNGAEQTITVTAITEGGNGAPTKVYLNPNEWEQGGAWFAVWMWSDGSNGKFFTMTKDTASGCYVVERGSYTSIIFLRMKNTATEPDWNDAWNQSGDLTIPSDKDTFKPEGWTGTTSSWQSTLTGTYGSSTVTLSATVVSGSDPNPPVPTSTTSTVTTTTLPQDGATIYVKAGSAPKIWVWQEDGAACCELMGYTWNTQPSMEAATGMNDGTGWYMFKITSANMIDGKPFVFILNQNSGNISSNKTKTFWYDNGTVYDADPTTPAEPVKPTVTLSPASGSTVRTTGSISITFTNGNDTITSASVNINGTNFDMGTTATTFTKTLEELGITDGDVNISVLASVTNSKGTTTTTASYTSKYVDPSKEDTFTWDNVNAYFVLTDRFYNGNTSNDNKYGRQRASGDEDVATFHGGDIKGLTDKIAYFENLGINAIWITAPYEQVHGWVAGGKNAQFPHYAFHGYYTLDWTAMDANMGTIDEFRTFVQTCHSKGIRVIMDVVMNHVGYNNVADMKTYNHGYTPHEATWFAKTDGKWNANDGVQWENSLWDNSWWGPWIRSFGYATGSDFGGSCGGLPDIKSEIQTSVGMAPVLRTKWNTDNSTVKSAYYNPSVANADWNGYSGDYRTDKGIAPADYQVVWLSAWVREFGIDGFRCDTAKHVEPYRWGQLKTACQAALEAWRNDTTKADNSGAKDWDENFWMTGECWGWSNIGTTGGDYYGTGKFDSMINFSFNGSQTGSTTSRYPSSSDWSSYISINSKADSDGNGNRDNVLSYISSHDTALCRASNQKEAGTGLLLLPGGVQIYYGDESSRPQAYTGCGDTDMFTRGDMNWNGGLTGAVSNGTTQDSIVDHWGKIGRFRKYNPAVGAGTGSATKRTYNGPAGENKVAISVSGTQVDVSDLWTDGKTVYNWYDKTSATVTGGKVTFQGGTMSQPILVSDKDPKNY